MSPTRSKAPAARPTLQSVAHEAGVSHQTVANVLNSPEKVRPETLARVLKVITALDYRPDETARSLARRSTRLVSLHLGPQWNDGVSMLADFARSLAQAGASRGYRIVLDVAEAGDEVQIHSFQELAARRAVDGVVIPETHVGDQRPRWLSRQRAPFVAFGRPWDDPDATHSWVDVDGGRGMRQVAHHLHDRGHTRVAYVGPPRDGGMEDDRHDGLVAGLTEAGVARDDGLDLFVAERTDLFEQLPDFLRRHRPTALACRDDSYAFEALQVLQAMDEDVARGVAVTGFDDSPLARMTRPALTSVSQQTDRVADLIFASLVAQIEGRQDEQVTRLIVPQLVTRESSTGPVQPPDSRQPAS